MADIAVIALACWAVVVVYYWVRFQAQHPLFIESIRRMGPEPPWDQTIERVQQPEWRERWTNQLDPYAASRLPLFLDVARYARIERQSTEHLGKRRQVYADWLRLCDALPTWSYDQPGRTLSDFKNQLDNSMLQVEAVGHGDVVDSIRALLAHAEVFIETQQAQLSQNLGWAAQRDEAVRLYRSILSDRHAQVIAAMQQDLGDAHTLVDFEW